MSMHEQEPAELTPAQDQHLVLSYLDELPKRLHRFGQRSKAIPANEQWSSEWFENIGEWWRSQREARQMTTYRATTPAQIPINVLRFVENGLADPDEITGDLLIRYAEALGQPELYDEFCERFQVTPFTPPETQS